MCLVHVKLMHHLVLIIDLTLDFLIVLLFLFLRSLIFAFLNLVLRFSGREDGNGQPPVHGNVLPPGVSSARQPSTAGGNLSPQRRRRRDTKLRVYAGHDPGADNGAGASAAAGKRAVGDIYRHKTKWIGCWRRL